MGGRASYEAIRATQAIAQPVMLVGWATVSADVGIWRMGQYTVEQIRFEGGEGGELLQLTGRSADMRSDLKEPLSEHFDQTTIGGVIKELAARHRLQAKVSPELVGRQVEYLARIEQSTMDFGTRLADRNGALFSVKGGKMLLLKRGEAARGSLTISKSQCESWEIETDPRPRYGEIETRWFDRETGEPKFEDASTGLQGPQKRLRHLLSSQGEAQAAAEAESDRMNRATGSGSVTLAGMPEAAAEMDIQLTGFRAEINGVWRAATVRHEFDGAYKTTIELEAPESGKEPPTAKACFRGTISRRSRTGSAVSRAASSCRSTTCLRSGRPSGASPSRWCG